MRRLLLLLVLLAAIPSFGQTSVPPLAQRPWFEVHTAHFHIYSCSDVQGTYKLAGQLEEFCRAYAELAGKDAVASPPIVVLAFPDHDTLKPFLPLYNGQPGNIAAFFTRGSDENLIVLSLDAPDMSVIFHEYTHLLLRRNDQIWPLWLKEGMAEIYSTFTNSGDGVEIARPIDRHLATLANAPMMPLPELFAVTHNSPQYNEATRQGVFYAESWLLTDYLMAGDSRFYRDHFGRFTELLRQGEMPEQAFTDALDTTLPAMQKLLRDYFKRGEFDPIVLKLSGSVSAPVTVTSTAVTPVEILFRFGDELLRIGRFAEARSYFMQAHQLAPASPLPYEGLGLLASQQDAPGEAVADLQQALQHGSTSFLAHYVYAEQQYKLTASDGMYGLLHGDAAAEIRGELTKAIGLMPDFAPAHELLGFFEMVQGDSLDAAEEQLQDAIALEPENASYQFTLAQAELRGRDYDAARRTLAPLLLPNVDAKLRASARELAQRINSAAN